MKNTPTLSLEIDGRTYVLRPKEIDALTAATFRAGTGISVEGLLRAIDTGEDDELGIVEVAQFAWLATIQNEGISETFADVAQTIRYDSTFGQMTATGLPSDDGIGDDGMLSLEDDPDEDVPEDLEGPEPVDPTNGSDGSSSDAPGFSPTVAGSSGTI